MIYAANMITHYNNHKNYSSSRTKEITGLINRGFLMLAALDDSLDHRIRGSLFVDYARIEETPEAYERSRFIISGFDDKHDLMTHAPTVTRALQRLLLLTTPSDEILNLKNREVDQVFAKSKSKLRCKLFVHSTLALRNQSNFLFEVSYPIYGLPEPPILRFTTDTTHCKQKLHMSPSIYDAYFMYTNRFLARFSPALDIPRGTVRLQTYKTIYT